ncbi:MAG TPA: glycosyltransferase family 4 protein [Burkholderiales bacterium]|jgi:glycosyltransferase involved in cell wall biosynthesis|nr:glycosyltransferase family 4 protein [Burkholderiales bacterium]
MQTQLFSTIAMLGAAPETRGGVASIVESYRANGLFTRWPIQYIATSCDGTAVQQTLLAAKAVRDFGLLLGEKKRVVVHVHASSGAGFWREAAFMGAALVAGSPVILHLHGNGFDRSIRWFLERAAVVCVPCEASRAWVKSVTRRAHVMIAPPPVAVTVPEVARPNLVLFLGHLEARKGIYDLLDAVARVRAAVPDLRLVCAGDGDRIGVAHYAERLGIADAVKFTGWVGPSGKRALLEHAAVFALPAYDAALPVSLIEAMSAGVPVVASPVGGIPEVVADGASGFLVAPGDKGALERALRKLLLEHALAKRMGAAARETARARYAPERALPVLENLYESLGVGAILDRTPRVQPVPVARTARDTA